MDKSDRKRAQFLVIYAPRRQCLEIWSLQRGPKVATFSVPRHGVLNQFTHNLMGVQHTAKLKSSSSAGLCLFIDPVDHQIKELTIPFHCANFNNANSKTAKDLHLFKRIKLCMRNMDAENEQVAGDEVRQLCREIETTEMLSQVVELLVGNKKIAPILLQGALEEIIGRFGDVADDADDTLKHLHVRCFNYLRLVNFFLLMTGAKSCEFEEKEEDNLVVEENLNISRQELETVQKLIDLATLANQDAVIGPKVTFG